MLLIVQKCWFCNRLNFDKFIKLWNSLNFETVQFKINFEKVLKASSFTLAEFYDFMIYDLESVLILSHTLMCSVFGRLFEKHYW